MKGALGVLLGLVAVELGLRLFAPQSRVTDELRYEALPGSEASGPGYRLQPRHVIAGSVGGRVNSLGLRGAEWGAKRGRRTVVLGDSFVFGAGVDADEAFATRLTLLVGGGEEFVNAGTPGYGTARELAWLESFGDGLEADALLLCVFVGNDFSDNLDGTAPRVIDGRLFWKAGALPDGPVEDWELRVKGWLGQLHLVRLVESRRRIAPAPKPKATPGRGLNEVERTAALGRLHETFARAQAGRLGVYLPADAGPGDVAWQTSMSYDMTHLALEGIADWCAARSLPLGVVAIPDVLAVDPVMRTRALAQGEFAGLNELDLGQLDFQRPTRELGTWCAALDTPFLDLTEAFTQRTAALQAKSLDSQGLYLFGDSHWNAAGHQLAAERIAEWRAASNEPAQ